MSAERKALEKQRNEYNELKRQFDKWPLAQREELQEQLSRVSVSTTLLCCVVPNGTGLCHLHRTSCGTASPLGIFLFLSSNCASFFLPCCCYFSYTCELQLIVLISRFAGTPPSRSSQTGNKATQKSNVNMQMTCQLIFSIHTKRTANVR